MKAFASIAVILMVVPGAFAADTDPSVLPARSSEIVEQYVSAVRRQQSQPESVSMEVDIDAKLPRLKKQGKLHALRFISKIGNIKYLLPRFEGDNTIKKDVIGRYLRAEKEARAEYSASAAITPENYKFKYKGMEDHSGRRAHVFQVSPRKKRIGLFKGEVWVDSETFLPLREWGELVKNPSVFLKSVYFVRDYAIVNGVSVPRRLISDVNTRVVGRAELTIWFENFKFGVPEESDDATQTSTIASWACVGAPRSNGVQSQ